MYEINVCNESANDICNVNLVVPADDTPRIQEMHIFIGHTICHLVDLAFDSN